jgi:hypothetical protein
VKEQDRLPVFESGGQFEAGLFLGGGTIDSLGQPLSFVVACSDGLHICNVHLPPENFKKFSNASSALDKNEFATRGAPQRDQLCLVGARRRFASI